MNQPIMVSRGEVVGIGKIKIPRTIEFNHEIQLLSFLSIKESEDSFISTCIHLRIDGYGKTEELADESMVKNVWYFLSQNFSKLSIEDAWDNLRDLFKSDDWSSELWDAYREVQMQLSMRGEPTEHTAELNFRLDLFEKQRAKEFEKWMMASELEKERIKELESDDYDNARCPSPCPS
ncbi:MAG: hypothetical protein LBI06_01915, partial [Treponema sp.]|nr:hypothetical protein [Treponema sp.]